jgi:hypothetical protein
MAGLRAGIEPGTSRIRRSATHYAELIGAECRDTNIKTPSFLCVSRIRGVLPTSSSTGRPLRSACTVSSCAVSTGLLPHKGANFYATHIRP